MQILTIQKGFESFKWKFETNSKHWFTNSKGIRSIRMEIQTLRTRFEAFECIFKVLTIRMQIRSIHTRFETFECNFYPFQRDSKYSNANLNHLNRNLNHWIANSNHLNKNSEHYNVNSNHSIKCSNHSNANLNQSSHSNGNSNQSNWKLNHSNKYQGCRKDFWNGPAVKSRCERARNF